MLQRASPFAPGFKNLPGRLLKERGSGKMKSRTPGRRGPRDPLRMGVCWAWPKTYGWCGLRALELCSHRCLSTDAASSCARTPPTRPALHRLLLSPRPSAFSEGQLRTVVSTSSGAGVSGGAHSRDHTE